MRKTFPPRQRDILDDINELRYHRLLAYQDNQTEKVLSLTQKLLNMRISMGWDERDALEEFENSMSAFKQPYSVNDFNPHIRYDLNDETGKARGLRLLIQQVSCYWAHIDGGLKHEAALSEVITGNCFS